jgi:hypothetical protein
MSTAFVPRNPRRLASSTVESTSHGTSPAERPTGDRDRPDVLWRSPQPGLWLATDLNGRPVGIVRERGHDGFVTTAVTGRDLGRHEQLHRAQHALEDSLAWRSA